MRWHKKQLQIGSERQIKRFLIFPRCINGECRCLEWATRKQQYGWWSTLTKHWTDVEWVDVEWVDK